MRRVDRRRPTRRRAPSRRSTSNLLRGFADETRRDTRGCGGYAPQARGGPVRGPTDRAWRDGEHRGAAPARRSWSATLSSEPGGVARPSARSRPRSSRRRAMRPGEPQPMRMIDLVGEQGLERWAGQRLGRLAKAQLEGGIRYRLVDAAHADQVQVSRQRLFRPRVARHLDGPQLRPWHGRRAVLHGDLVADLRVVQRGALRSVCRPISAAQRRTETVTYCSAKSLSRRRPSRPASPSPSQSFMRNGICRAGSQLRTS
jgi:hypothetical protein